MLDRRVPRFTDADPMALSVEFEGECPLPQPRWCDEQAPDRGGKPSENDRKTVEAQCLIATPETDAKLCQENLERGRTAARRGFPITTCPHDPTSMVGQWWRQGWCQAEETSTGPGACTLAQGSQKSPSELPRAASGHSAQRTSDAAHADPMRHNAAKLARLAEAWVDNAMGLARSMERLREMHGLLDALERGWLAHLERHERERELVGVGMSDRCMEDRA